MRGTFASYNLNRLPQLRALDVALEIGDFVVSLPKVCAKRELVRSCPGQFDAKKLDQCGEGFALELSIKLKALTISRRSYRTSNIEFYVRHVQPGLQWPGCCLRGDLKRPL